MKSSVNFITECVSNAYSTPLASRIPTSTEFRQTLTRSSQNATMTRTMKKNTAAGVGVGALFNKVKKVTCERGP